MKIITAYLSILFAFATTISSFALDPDERFFFGLTELESTHPELTGEGYTVGISDTEFDVTHPGLGWTGPADYNTWFYSRQYIPQLNRINPRIFMSGHRDQTDKTTEIRHGVSAPGFKLPITQNNTLMTNIWRFHGTAVAGTAAGGLPGPSGTSLGAAPKARLVLASDTENFKNLLSMVPDGNPTRTVSMNRSFTGSSYVDGEMLRNAGVIGVNAAGNYFTYRTKDRTKVFGRSPQFSSIRWMDSIGYDLIASGLTLEFAGSNGYANSSGSMRSQESIFTDYSVKTLRPGGYFDSSASGTSFASPLLAGGITLVQQAYENAHPGQWLRVDQMQRILKKSGKFVDDRYTGLRHCVADFSAAVTLAENYVYDPSYEPNFSTSFDPEPRVNWALGETYFINPLQFRLATTYNSNTTYEFTTAIMANGHLQVNGNTGSSNVNIALRNNWGDMARIDLTEPGKKFTATFNYNTFPGYTGNSTEFFIGIKEMVGSVQFMDANRMYDNIDRGRLAFRIRYTQGDSQARIDLLQCSELPVLPSPGDADPIWQRANYYGIPNWDATPLATAYASSLHDGSEPSVEASFTSSRAVLKINGATIIDSAHTADLGAITRSTPYMHFRNNQQECEQTLASFTAQTTSGAIPIITRENIRLRALEGVNGVTAQGIVKVRRTAASGTPLTVQYSVGGSAINGQDYEQLPGSITIPANMASADILIKPLNDNSLETIETVDINLSPSGAYSISPYSDTETTISIIDYSDIDNDGIKSWDEDVNNNGDLSDDDANANLLPNYLDYLDTVPTNNVAPVADAGDDREVVGLETITLDGTASYDTDGDILFYSWAIISNPDNGPATLEYASTANATIRWDGTTEDPRSVIIELTVTDNNGATDRDTITVTQIKDTNYNKYYNQVYFRGSPNGWGTTLMELVDHNTWETIVDVNSDGQTFKFDIYGNWSLNFGDNNNDGYLEIEGGNIPFTEGSGMYRIRFNDQNHSYSVEKIYINQLPVANAGADTSTYSMNPVTLDGGGSYDTDGTIVSYDWTIIAGNPGPVSMTGASTATPTLQWSAPPLGARTAIVQLVVSDNIGATATDSVTVVQTSTQVFSKNHQQVYFRGSANGWGTTSMALVSNYTWQIQTDFNSGNDNRFKFDINGDWSYNFGDNNNDGYVDQGAGDIAVTQGDGTYTIWYNDQTGQYSVRKVIGNQAPVANAGQDQEVGLDGATVTLSAGSSYDPDGSIVTYKWTQTSGPLVSMNGTGLENATVFILSRTTAATYVFELKVTDDEGATDTDTVTVEQKAGGFNKTYDQVYFRGSPNNWGTTLMALVSNYVWETEQTFGDGSNERFKFDINGDWSFNFGDNNSDGYADQDGGDIGVTDGGGDYILRFNDQTKQYWVIKVGGGSFNKDHESITVAGTMNGWNPSANNMTLIDNYTWSGTFTLNGNVQLKFSANGSWGENWGENDQPGSSVPLNGYLENNGGNISLNNLAGATYRITMNERTRAYSVTVVTGTEAGAARNLVGWEAKYSLDLLMSGNGSDDPDKDTLTNMDEYHLGTNPFAKDTDRDGMCDRTEVVSATDPLDNGDYLSATPVMTDAGIVIEWPTEANRLYKVEASRDLNTWKSVSEWMTPGETGEVINAEAAEGYLYFRVLVGEMGVVGTTD